VTTDGESAEPVERFHPTSGYVGGYLTLAAVAGLLVYLLVADRSVTGLRLGTGAIFFGVLTWVTQLRPRVLAYASSLVVLNSVRDVVIPLVAVDRVEVTRVLSIWAGGKRYICTGIGAPPRKRSKVAQEPAAGEAPPHDVGRYVAFVKDRITGLVRDAAQRSSDGVGTADPQVRHVWAWAPLLALVVTGAAFVGSLAL
jgi:hypothetical protein